MKSRSKRDVVSDVLRLARQGYGWEDIVIQLELRAAWRWVRAVVIEDGRR